jgi:hypothetical protein
MQITEILRQMGGLQSMARELGVSEAEVQSGAAALAPAGGGLGAWLDMDRDGNPLDDILRMMGGQRR